MIEIPVVRTEYGTLKAYFYACEDCGETATVNQLKSLLGDDTPYGYHVGYEYDNHRYFRQEYFYLDRVLNWVGMNADRIKWIEKVLGNVKLINMPVKTKQHRLF